MYETDNAAHSKGKTGIIITDAEQTETLSGETPAPKQKMTFKEIGVQFLKFTAFSLGAGIIESLSFAFFNELTPLGYWVSYFIALVLSVLYNFTVNRRYTFKAASNVPVAMTLVFIFYCFFAPYSIGLTILLADIHGWNEYLVLAIVMVQNLILEFLWCRYVVYRKKMNTMPGKNKEPQK